jgi:hypothetical protein
LSGETRTVSIIGSANLTRNAGFEVMVLSSDDKMHKFIVESMRIMNEESL